MSKSTIKGITIQLGADTQKLTKSLEGVNKQSREIQGELRQVERLLKLDPSNTTLLAQKQKLLADAVSNTKNKLDTLKEAERQVQQQFERGEVGEEQYRAVQREVIRTEQNLQSLEQQLNNVNNSWKNTAENLDKFGKKTTEVGKNLSKKVTAPIVATGVAATKMGSDFADAIAKVDTIADTSQVPLNDLRKSILDLSNQTGISATEIANNVYDAISAGQETGDAVAFVESSTALAKAGFAEAGQSLDILTTIMNAYGMEAGEVGKVSDMLIQTQNKGKVTVGELSSVMGKVIPTAKSMGVELDQVGASYAILTANGIKAAEATTYTNSMLNELGKTGSKSDKELRKLTGQSFKELIESGSSVSDVLSILNESASQSGLSLADMFGSAEASKAALVLLGEDASIFNEMVGQMNNSLGSTETAFEKLQTPGENFRIAMNKMKNALIELGDILQPVLEKLAGFISTLADKFAGLSDNAKFAVVAVGGLVAAIGPLLLVIGQMSIGLSALIGLFGGTTAAATGTAAATAGATTATSTFGSVIAAITGPIGIAIAAIAGITAVIVALWKTNEEFRENVKVIWEQIKEIFNLAMIYIQELVTTIYTQIMEFWQTNSDNIKAITQALWDAVGNIFNSALQIIQGILDVFIGIFTGNWERFGIGLQTIWQGVWRAIESIIDAAKTIIQNIVLIFINFVSNKWEGFGNTLQTIWDTVWNTIQTVIDSILTIIQGLIDTFTGIVTGDWKTFTGGLKTIWSGMWDGIKAIVEGAWRLLSGAFSSLWDNISGWFGDLVDDAFDWGKNMIDGFVDGIKSMISKVKSAVSSVTSAAKGYIGFNSPAKEGEGRHIVDWGYNMIDGFIDGMNKAMPELEKSARGIMPVVKNEIVNTTQIDYSKIPKGETVINVYNPQPSPSELSRQIKKTQQELALGF